MRHETPDWFDEMLAREEIEPKEYYIRQGYKQSILDPDLGWLSPRSQHWIDYWGMKEERSIEPTEEYYQPEEPEKPSLITSILRWLFDL